jgi:signal transduction histidine kinase
VSAGLTGSGFETAQQLADGMVRALPVTVASVALWDQPSLTLTVRGVSTCRATPSAVLVGARVPLAQAEAYRTVFEQHEPVFVERSVRAVLPDELGHTLMPDLRSAFLVPIRFGQELIGVLALGEMRSPEREPFPEAKRQQCLALLESFVARSADAWEANRLRRQVRSMGALIRIIRQMLDARTPRDVLGGLASRVAEWLGIPVRGILLRRQPHGMDVATRWGLTEALPEGEVAQLLLALGRAEGQRSGPVSVVRVADDPLDPFHDQPKDGAPWTRVALPLLQGEQLLGVACLYVEDELHLADWELEALRWLGEITAVGLGAVSELEVQQDEQAWLARVAWDLSTTHQRIVLREGLDGLVGRLSARLGARLEQAAPKLDRARADADRPWQQVADLTTREIAGLLDELAEPGAGEPAGAARMELNELVRRTVALAQAKWAGGGAAPPRLVRLTFDPAPEPLLVATSVGLVGALVGALVLAIESALHALPEDGEVRVRTHRDDGHAVITVTGAWPGLEPDAFTPLLSVGGRPGLGPGLWVVRALATRHGGHVELVPDAAGGATLQLRLPVAPAGA